ncbi:MAG: 5-amino-6-(D-ribitylamino)uracil--L-tyrosine 4-hydroxyphenyl transferase CofH [Candidatus Acidiferrales bacterium]
MFKSLDPSWRAALLADSLREASPGIRAILERSLEGRELDFDEALQLTSADGPDLLALVKTADAVRRRIVGDAITYVVNRNLNFTNVCFVGCSFCGFSRGPGAADAYLHPIDALVAKCHEAVARGATEVCIQGGLPRNFDGSFYAALLRAVKGELPGLHIHAYSPMEISYGVERTGLELREYLATLHAAGLGSIPGTAAEILDDEVRRALSPNKLCAARWVEIIRAAHSLGIPSTSTMMYGHVERPEHWVRHMILLREIQKDTGGFTEFVPLAFIHPQTRLYQIGGARPGSTLREDLIVHALARLLFQGWIRNIQVSWVKLGFDGALACLEAGANDFSGTLMEESISKAAGAGFGESVEPHEFHSLIRSIGRIPAERSTTYKILHIFAVVPGEGNESLPRSVAREPNLPDAALLETTS